MHINVHFTGNYFIIINRLFSRLQIDGRACVHAFAFSPVQPLQLSVPLKLPLPFAPDLPTGPQVSARLPNQPPRHDPRQSGTTPGTAQGGGNVGGGGHGRLRRLQPVSLLYTFRKQFRNCVAIGTTMVGSSTQTRYPCTEPGPVLRTKLGGPIRARRLAKRHESDDQWTLLWYGPKWNGKS